jgi:hypothetical protein
MQCNYKHPYLHLRKGEGERRREEGGEEGRREDRGEREKLKESHTYAWYLFVL